MIIRSDGNIPRAAENPRVREDSFIHLGIKCMRIVLRRERKKSFTARSKNRIYFRELYRGLLKKDFVCG